MSYTAGPRGRPASVNLDPRDRPVPSDAWGASAADMHDADMLADAALAEGRKDDGGKAPYHLIAPEALHGMAMVLDYGTRKYAPRNWEKGMAWSRCFSAAMRHLWAWWRGERSDPESGMPHLWHAAFCVMALIAYESRGAGTDDRHIIPHKEHL